MDKKDFFTAKEFREVVGDKIFSAEFEKKDGTVRKIVARLGVKKALQGGELKYNPEDYNNLIVYDMQKKGYRTIPFDKLRNICYDGLEESFEE